MAGILGSLAYVLSPMEFFGATANYALKIAFGPLMAVAYLGFFAFFRVNRLSSVLYLATMLGVLAGIIVNMMLLVHGIQAYFTSAEVAELMGAAWYASNSVQLGLDISRDLYLALATVLLGIVLWDHPRFHRVFALVTSLIGLSFLLINLWHFPIPPSQAGAVDLSALVGGWYLIILLRVLRSRKWLEEQLHLGRILSQKGLVPTRDQAL